MKWKAFLLIVCAAGLAPAEAAPAVRQEGLAQALALPVASGLTGASGAPRFAWVESAAGVRNAWFAERGRAARRLTAFDADDGQQLYGLALNAAGTSLAFVRGGDPEHPDDPLPNAGSEPAAPLQQLFVTATGGGASTLIGEGHSPVFAPSGDLLAYSRGGEIWLWDRADGARKLATVEGRVRQLSWSPDGSWLLFVDHREDHSFVALLDVAKQRLRYLDAGLGYSEEAAFSPDGRRVAFVRHLAPPPGSPPQGGAYWSIRIADAATGQGRQLWAAPPGMGGRYMGTRSRNLFWSADGQIVFPWERSGWLHPHALDAGGGRPRDLTPGAFEVETFLLAPDSRSLIYAANAGDLDRRHVWRRALAGGAPVRLTSGDRIESAPTFGASALAVIATGVGRPAYPALAGGKLAALGRTFVAQGFVAPVPVRFRAEDGVEVHGQLFRRRGSGKRPALVYLHGGPRRQMLLGFHPSGYYSNAYVMNQHLAARGYDVLAVNYRSGTGYGAAFRDAAETGRGGASEYRDVLAARRWLAARPDVDDRRVGVWGGSWGGYLAALALARNSDLFAAGVDFHGVHSLLRAVPDSLSPDAQLAARRLQWVSSPMAAIDGWRSPVLLIHGGDDRNVDFAQSLLLARELAARQIPFRDLVFPNERHGFFRHAHWLESLRATEAFLDEMLLEKRPAQ